MAEFVSGETLFPPISIRYDGLDASRHEIELGALGESLQGISRIIGVAANFAATQRFVQHKDALSVRIVARPPQAHCFEVMAWVRWAAENPLVSTVVGGLLATLVTYIVKRAAGQKEEMKHLRDSLETAIKELGARDSAVVGRLLDTVDKMADALRPAVRQAAKPVGETAASLTIGDPAAGRVAVIGQAERAAIMAPEEVEVQPEKDFTVVFTELDTESGSCRVVFPDEPDQRCRGAITDPAVMQPNNPYALALAAQRPLTVRAKAVTRDGALERLFISDSRPAQA
ncbi:MAG: hypothetical protein LCH95_19285 [Proteobacteria bacterium]|nr:hypothetical protein [Pseudomonadota bacterium]